MLLPKQSRNYVTGLAAACSLLLIACSPEEVRQVNLIPKPEQMTMTGGTFTVDSLALFGGQSSRNIKTVIDEAWSGNPEGYQLDVTPGGIDLRAGSPDGLFYGMQTLRQLYAGGEVPCVSIRDNPRFGYRGLHLDVSRHFFSKEEVMKLLDVMSFYKLNTLHMHLTDAGGWRIEIDKYPKLTSETAFRTESDWRKWWDGRDRKYLPEGTPGAYGGYYTKEDIREIVKHAASKHINIIPEIEFPGHSEEVLMAYPELSCSGKPYQNGDFCIGNEQSFTFMEDVLAELPARRRAGERRQRIRPPARARCPPTGEEPRPPRLSASPQPLRERASPPARAPPAPCFPRIRRPRCRNARTHPDCLTARSVRGR